MRHKWIGLAALMALGMSVTGCDSLPGTGTPAGPQADTRELAHNGDLRGACEPKRSYFPRAAAYAGAGPHPIVAFVTTDLGSVNEVATSYWDSNRPLQWGRVEPARTQIVACLGRAGKGEFVTSCSFDDGKSVPLHRGRYDVTVYEAATGKELGTEQMQGAVGAGARCPLLTWLSAEDPVLYTEPDFDQFRSVLGKYVDRSLAVAAPTSTAPALVADISGLCTALAADIPAQARSLPTRHTNSGGSDQSCTWGSDSYDRDNPAPPPRLRVNVTAHAGTGSATSGTETAGRRYESDHEFMAQNGTVRPVAGLGDRAALENSADDLVVGVGSGARRYPGLGTRLITLTRNVTIDISWSGPAAEFPAERTEAEVTDLAHRVIARLPS
ncbi:hypothetical protein ACFVMC_26765 [Nocardia sp. NPDC127579]|uniref:hypothetical protein n=1 Tax=Nocardia sp. NPDC127579 TaxID=3345402 RepID=UPI00363EA62D